MGHIGVQSWAGYSCRRVVILGETPKRYRVYYEDPSRWPARLGLFGAATFLQLPKLADALEHQPAERDVHVRLANVAYIDHASLDLLPNFESARREPGTTVLIDWNEPVARRANRPVAEVEQAAGEKTGRPVA